MTFSRTLRRFAALTAASAIALQALWPLIAQARPADSISVPLCSVDGVRHEIELPLGKNQGDRSFEHCKLCVLGTGNDVAAPFQVSVRFSPGTENQVFEEKQRPAKSTFSSSANPRAPPVAS